MIIFGDVLPFGKCIMTVTGVIKHFSRQFIKIVTFVIGKDRKTGKEKKLLIY